MDLTEEEALELELEEDEEMAEAQALQRDLQAMHESSRNGASASSAAGAAAGASAAAVDTEWARRTRRRVVSPAYMDRLLMNYLVVEGHKEAAAALAEEAGVAPPVDLRTIEDRMQVRAAITRGDVEAALAGIERIDPELLARDGRLAFSLRLQHLLELVRQGKTAEALRFARRELAPLGEADPQHLRTLEAAMALLVFGAGGSGPEPNKAAPPSTASGLLDPARRVAVAEEANAAILQAQQQDSEPVLPALIRALMQAQEELKECGVPAGGEGKGGLAATVAWFR